MKPAVITGQVSWPHLARDVTSRVDTRADLRRRNRARKLLAARMLCVLVVRTFLPPVATRPASHAGDFRARNGFIPSGIPRRDPINREKTRRARKQSTLDFYVIRTGRRLTFPFVFFLFPLFEDRSTAIFFFFSYLRGPLHRDGLLVSSIHPGEGHIDYFFSCQ